MDEDRECELFSGDLSAFLEQIGLDVQECNLPDCSLDCEGVPTVNTPANLPELTTLAAAVKQSGGTPFDGSSAKHTHPFTHLHVFDLNACLDQSKNSLSQSIVSGTLPSNTVHKPAACDKPCDTSIQAKVFTTPNCCEGPATSCCFPKCDVIDSTSHPTSKPLAGHTDSDPTALKQSPGDRKHLDFLEHESMGSYANSDYACHRSEQRKMHNRIASRKCRERKKEKDKNLASENQRLIRTMRMIQAENQLLKNLLLSGVRCFHPAGTMDPSAPAHPDVSTIHPSTNPPTHVYPSTMFSPVHPPVVTTPLAAPPAPLGEHTRPFPYIHHPYMRHKHPNKTEKSMFNSIQSMVLSHQSPDHSQPTSPRGLSDFSALSSPAKTSPILPFLTNQSPLSLIPSVGDMPLSSIPALATNPPRQLQEALPTNFSAHAMPLGGPTPAEGFGVNESQLPQYTLLPPKAPHAHAHIPHSHTGHIHTLYMGANPHVHTHHVHGDERVPTNIGHIHPGIVQPIPHPAQCPPLSLSSPTSYEDVKKTDVSHNLNGDEPMLRG